MMVMYTRALAVLVVTLLAYKGASLEINVCHCPPCSSPYPGLERNVSTVVRKSVQDFPTPPGAKSMDMIICGGGGAGGDGLPRHDISCPGGGYIQIVGAGGGGGGSSCMTVAGISLEGITSFPIVIGEGGKGERKDGQDSSISIKDHTYISRGGKGGISAVYDGDCTTGKFTTGGGAGGGVLDEFDGHRYDGGKGGSNCIVIEDGSIGGCGNTFPDGANSGQLGCTGGGGGAGYIEILWHYENSHFTYNEQYGGDACGNHGGRTHGEGGGGGASPFQGEGGLRPSTAGWGGGSSHGNPSQGTYGGGGGGGNTSGGGRIGANGGDGIAVLTFSF